MTAEVIEHQNEGTWAFGSGMNLPFLFDVRADNLKRRFEMTITDVRPDRYVLSMKPRLAVDLGNFSELVIMLHPATFRPTALKVLDPGGNLETVYVFSNWSIQEEAADVDQFQFDPTGYLVSLQGTKGHAVIERTGAWRTGPTAIGSGWPIWSLFW
jgi:hypothetical protein